jgi:hypothetical protein
MPRFYLDSHDGDIFIEDEEGLEFSDLEAVKVEAARALADLAREVIPGSERRKLWIEVRDEARRPVLKTVMIFEVQVLAGSA